MKAAPEHQAALLTLQEIDNKIAGAHRQMASLSEESAQSAVDAEILALSPLLIEISGKLEDSAQEMLRIESDIELVNNRISLDTQRVDESTSAKDITGLQHELQTLLSRKSELEDAEFVVLEQSEQLQLQLSELQSQRETLVAQRANISSQISRDQEDLRNNIGSLDHTRSEVAQSIPDDLLALYEKQRLRYGIGAALLREGVSGGSGVALSAHHLEEIRQSDPSEIILCPDSNCILVRTDESGL